MSVLKNINIRPIKHSDLDQIDAWRRQYPEAFLELPHGVAGNGVETACAEKEGQLIGSLTGIAAIVIDPFIHNPAMSGPDVFAAVYLMERALTYKAQVAGAVDSYIAVPDQSTAYHAIVEKSGYVKTCEHCTIFRRPLRPDTVALIENEQGLRL